MDYETMRLRLRDIMLELVSAPFMGMNVMHLNELSRKLKECDHPAHAVLWMQERLQESSRAIVQHGFPAVSNDELEKVNAALTAFQQISEDLIADWTKVSPLPVVSFKLKHFDPNGVDAQVEKLLDAYDGRPKDTGAMVRDAWYLLCAYKLIPGLPQITTTPDESRSEPRSTPSKGHQPMSKIYLANAFSLNMLSPETTQATLVVGKVKEVSPVALRVLCHDAESVVGHPDTARLFSTLTGLDVPCNRASVQLSPGDQMIVGQYVGARLPEGARVDWFIGLVHPRGEEKVIAWGHGFPRTKHPQHLYWSRSL